MQVQKKILYNIIISLKFKLVITICKSPYEKKNFK